MTAYTLAEVRNGTGWPEGVRFTVATEPPKREPFPVAGHCPHCTGQLGYVEDVTEYRALTFREDGCLEASDPEQFDGSSNAHIQCGSCVREFDFPQDWADGAVWG